MDNDELLRDKFLKESYYKNKKAGDLDEGKNKKL